MYEGTARCTVRPRGLYTYKAPAVGAFVVRSRGAIYGPPIYKLRTFLHSHTYTPPCVPLTPPESVHLLTQVPAKQLGSSTQLLVVTWILRVGRYITIQ